MSNDQNQTAGAVLSNNGLGGWRTALEDALSVCQSVHTGRDRRVVRDGCVLYLQTEEWCKWAEEEVAPKLRAALAAPQPAESVPDCRWPQTGSCLAWMRSAPQRQPLTAPQILELMPATVPASYDGQLIEFARTVEAAHGIKPPNA